MFLFRRKWIILVRPKNKNKSYCFWFSIIFENGDNILYCNLVQPNSRETKPNIVRYIQFRKYWTCFSKVRKWKKNDLIDPFASTESNNCEE